MSTVANTIDIPSYTESKSARPLFVLGDCLDALRDLPDACVDCCITSPPYWGQRQYAENGIGLEATWGEYVSNLAMVCNEVRRALKPTGSLWLNIGDTYEKKRLLGIPWRVAFALTDNQGWILRNDVIWNKVKGGPDNSKDKLRNTHEYLFHFVKTPRGYYYNADTIRATPQRTRVVKGAIVSATGVSGVRYQRQIELSTALSAAEKTAASKALEDMLQRLREGSLADFRMIIRGQQRTTHSDSDSVSGRARELMEKGFYFLRYHPNGSKPRDVWDIIPEDTQGRKAHFAPFPEDLCKLPILATCPEDGVVLDPFCGTGTAMLAAFHLGRKSIGVDVSAEYLKIARERCRLLI
jgi:site-specific DNA-methyltransferase (adenine-specific)